MFRGTDTGPARCVVRTGTVCWVSVILGLSACTRVVDTQDLLRVPPVSAADAASEIGFVPAGYTASVDFVTTPDGARLHRLRLQHAQARSTLVYWGGNQFQIRDEVKHVMGLFAQGWQPNVVLVDYRGYGRSTGVPTASALLRDAQQVLALERARASAEDKKLLVAGYSMGAAMAARASSAPVDGVVLIAAMTTVQDLVHATRPWHEWQRVQVSSDLLALNATRDLASYRGPLLVLVGDQDRTTPLAMARQLQACAATPDAAKPLIVVPGANHSTIQEAPQVRSALAAFARAHQF